MNTREEILVNMHPEDRPGVDRALQEDIDGITDRYEVDIACVTPTGNGIG